MSRVASNYNQWGTGDLNGPVSADNKVNGLQIKRYGPLGKAGVGGVVKNHGGVHEVVYELSGDGILVENGINVSEAHGVEIPPMARVTGVTIVNHEGFATGSVVQIDMASQAVAGTGDRIKNSIVDGELVDETTVGNNEGVLTVTAASLLTFEKGGFMTLDYNNLAHNGLSPQGGTVEVIVAYVAL